MVLGALLARDPTANASLIPEVLRLVRADPEPGVRCALAGSLGLPSLRPQSSVILPALREALRAERDPGVRLALEVAVRRLR